MSYWKIFMYIFLAEVLAVRASAASRCFDGFRVESLSNTITDKQDASVVTFSFSYAAPSGGSSAIVINAPIDVSRLGAAFVLNTALNSANILTLCFSNPTEIDLVDAALRKKPESGKPRDEIQAKSLTAVNIPNLK